MSINTHCSGNEKRVKELEKDLLSMGFRVSLQPFQPYQNTFHAFYNLCHLSFGGLYRVVNGLPVLFVNDPLIYWVRPINGTDSLRGHPTPLISCGFVSCEQAV